MLTIMNACGCHAGFSAEHALSKEATERLDADEDLGLDAEEVGDCCTQA